LPENVLDALRQFTEVQSLIVHGRPGVSDDEVLRAIDSGLVILRAIQAIPHETHIVERAGVSLFSDAEGKAPREDCKGVILETHSAGGAIRRQGIYPTTRSHFRKDLRVAWEWNPKLKWGETWYRDPDSGDMAYAWSESIEFCGRNIDEL
jgi:hypothetical protein